MAKVYIDPTTGDELNRSEWVALRIQNLVIRRWWFLIQFTLVTIAVVCTFNINVVGWWNVYASYLAIFVEAIVGRYMASQTRRDSQVMREVRTVLHEVKELVNVLQEVAHRDAKHSQIDLDIDLDTNEKIDHIINILEHE